VIEDVHSRYARFVVEQAAIGGAFDPNLLQSAEKANEAAAEIAKRLDARSEETERGWGGHFAEGEGFRFERMVRGVKEVAIIDPALLGSVEAKKLDDFAASLQQLYPRPGVLKRKGEETVIHGPTALFDSVIAAGRKGVTLQRYKGLGEMNPDQLWQTTLDTNARSLLQVRIKEVDEANILFDQLMGDNVDPRREFIQDNALAASVDV